MDDQLLGGRKSTAALFAKVVSEVHPKEWWGRILGILQDQWIACKIFETTQVWVYPPRDNIKTPSMEHLVDKSSQILSRLQVIYAYDAGLFSGASPITNLRGFLSMPKVLSIAQGRYVEQVGPRILSTIDNFEVKVLKALEDHLDPHHSFHIPSERVDICQSQNILDTPLSEMRICKEIWDYLNVLAGLIKIGNAGYVHGDVKPENILKHCGVGKLIDFELCLPKELFREMITPSDYPFWPPHTEDYLGKVSRIFIDRYGKKVPEAVSRYFEIGLLEEHPDVDIWGFGMCLYAVFGMEYIEIVEMCLRGSPKKLVYDRLLETIIGKGLAPPTITQALACKFEDMTLVCTHELSLSDEKWECIRSTDREQVFLVGNHYAVTTLSRGDHGRCQPMQICKIYNA